MSKFNLYETVTKKIIASLEQGVIPWHQPWQSSGVPSNFKTGYRYRGLNLVLLLMEGHSVPYYLTFKQAHEMGGRIKKGAKSSLIIYWSLKTDENLLDSNGKKKTYPISQYYHVFNVTQTEGIDYQSKFQPLENFNPIPACDEILLRYKDCPPIQHLEQSAYYSPSRDIINLPARNSFLSEEDYYLTAFHECIHSTGHSSRLSRPLSIAGDGYSKEELIAEMGASFLCGYAHMNAVYLKDAASYIKFWLTQLKEDKKFIFSITGQAQRAVEYILGYSNNINHCQKQEVAQ